MSVFFLKNFVFFFKLFFDSIKCRFFEIESLLSKNFAFAWDFVAFLSSNQYNKYEKINNFFRPFVNLFNKLGLQLVARLGKFSSKAEIVLSSGKFDFLKRSEGSFRDFELKFFKNKYAFKLNKWYKLK